MEVVVQMAVGLATALKVEAVVAEKVPVILD